MKPFYSSKQHSDKKNLWEYIPESDACKKTYKNEKKAKRKNKKIEVVEMIRSSQMNLDSCLKGKVKILFISLYPVERGWFNERDLIDFLTSDKKIAKKAACMSGIDLEIVTRMQKVIDNNQDEINYFDEMVREYHYLNSDKAKSSEDKKQFIIAKSYEDIESVISNPDDDRIILIVSIEGGHSLCKFDNFHDLKKTPFKKVDSNSFLDYEKYRKIYFNHIDIIKGKGNHSINVDGHSLPVSFEHVPLYITFAHHYWNLLCGHTDSFGFKPDLVLNQGHEKGKGFTKLGKDVLHKLLERNNGKRRILIDIKHLSIKSRKQFYEIWEDFHANGDGFPIISSHTAINGRADYQAPILNDDENTNAYYENFFNMSAINMFDNDIKMIHKSDGLLGLILNESRLPGLESRDFLRFNKSKIKEIEKKFRKKKISEDDRNRQIAVLKNENKHEYLKCLTANIFHISRVINDKSAWDIISIGSDFDGMIDALDSYTKADHFSAMADDLIGFIDTNNSLEEIGLSASEMQRLKFGYSTEMIAEKIMRGNAIDFLKKYYNDSFLKQGVIPGSNKAIV
jgi:microsomal dipeptidase-like Zn-dependent dipeptidase